MRYNIRRNGKSRKAKAANRNQNNRKDSVNNGLNQKGNDTKQEQPSEETPEEKIVRKAYELAPEWKISQSAKRRFLNLPSAFQTQSGSPPANIAWIR